MENILEGIGDVLGEIWGWLGDHIEVIVILVLIGLIVGGMYLLIGAAQREFEYKIALCQRAYEYTRDQCEFIVRNHSPIKP
jgi:hypothetical protein